MEAEALPFLFRQARGQNYLPVGLLPRYRAGMLAARVVRQAAQRWPGRTSTCISAGRSGSSVGRSASAGAIAPAASGLSLALCSIRATGRHSSNRTGSWFSPRVGWSPARLSCSRVRLGVRAVRPAGTPIKSTRGVSSFFPRGGGYSDSMVIYGVVGLNVAGTVALFLHETQGTGGVFLFSNFMVSTYTTLTQGRLYTLFSSNFSHSNLWNGAIFSYMLYTLGPTAIQHLGRRQFLALYLLGGAFSQLCQVAGPEIARRFSLPTVLQVDPYFISSGGSGATLAVLAWYCATFPGSQIILLVVPVQTGVAGALYLGATLYQVVTNGAAVPFLGGPTQEIWRTLGAVAAGVAVAVASRGRGGGRYKFIQRH